jgi:hypothetical protein
MKKTYEPAGYETMLQSCAIQIQIQVQLTQRFSSHKSSIMSKHRPNTDQRPEDFHVRLHHQGTNNDACQRFEKKCTRTFLPPYDDPTTLEAAALSW